MPRKRRDSGSDEDSSSSGGEFSDFDSKKPDLRKSRDMKGKKDEKYHKEGSSAKKSSSSSKHSLVHSRRHSPLQDKRQVDDKKDTKRRTEKDKQGQDSENRRNRDESEKRRTRDDSEKRRIRDDSEDRCNRDDSKNRRNIDTNERKVVVDWGKEDHRRMSKDSDFEKMRKGEDSGSASHLKYKNNRDKDEKEGDNYLTKERKDERQGKELNENFKNVRKEKGSRSSSIGQKPSKDSDREREEWGKRLSPKRSRQEPSKRLSPERSRSKHKKRLSPESSRQEQRKKLPPDSSRQEQEKRLSSDGSQHKGRSSKDDRKVASHSKKLKHKEMKRETSTSSSSSSSSKEHSSESDSDTQFDRDDVDRKIVRGNKESVILPLRCADSDDRDISPEGSEKGKSAVKMSDASQEVAVKRKLSRNNSEASSSENEEENSNNKKMLSETEVDVRKDRKILPSEKKHSSEDKLVENKERNLDSEEEKEEGEISEDNEDKIIDQPLKAISDYVSDISSDDGHPEFKDDQQQPLTPIPQPSFVDSKVPADIAKKSDKNVEHVDKISKIGSKMEKRRVTMLEKNVIDLNHYSEVRKRGADFSDREVIEGEDNSKRQRPMLESDSDDESFDGNEEKGSAKSNIQGKQKMGSSVTIVKQQARRDHDRSVNRGGSRNRGWDDGRNKERDRRSRHDDERGARDKRAKYDTNRDRKDRNTESKRVPDNSEQKNTPSATSAKSENSEASKSMEEPGKKTMAAFDITTKTGGAYIPPAKLRMMQEMITDKTSVAYQRMSWEALKKSINGLINKVNVSNIINIIKELFQENIVRGRGLLARSVIQAQAASPTFTHVYAALVAIINTKFPQNGELILRRLILMFRRGFKRNDKALCLSSTTFIAHLVNQQVAHEVLALEILTLLLENPTDDSVEIAVGFLKECGQKLTEVSPRGINSIFERLRNVLHEGLLDVRVQYMVEVMFAIRKDGFKDHPSVIPDLDLAEEDDQFTHLLQLEDAVAGDEMLNVFREDPVFAENEEKYKILKKEILDEGSSDEESGGSSESGSSESDSDDEEKENAEKQTIIDKTETNLVALRRTIYLTIQSSLDHNECAHKILKMDMKPGQEVELCNMILDCCAQLRTYEKFFGLLAQRFCQIDKKYIEPFQQIFIDQYETIHRLETNKLRNVAKFFAHLLHTDAISWGVLSVVKLTEEDTSSASRIFLKILFQELSEYMGLLKLNERLKDPTLSQFFEGIMARDNPKNTRFCINFFTTIGLGGLTDDLREHLKSAAKQIAQQNQEAGLTDNEESSTSSDSSSDSDSDSSSGSDSDSPSKRKRKSSAAKTKKKADKETPKSKKKTTEKENKRARAHKQKSSGRESKSESRSRSSGKGARNMHNVSSEKNTRTIADRLLDMAQYGNIRNGEEKSRDRIDTDAEVRPSMNRRNKERGVRDNQDYFDRSGENGERWGQRENRWNGRDDRGERKDENMGYGSIGGEGRGQRFQDDRRREGWHNQGNTMSRRNNSYEQNDSWGRRTDTESGSQKRWRDDHHEVRQDGDRGRDPQRAEKRKDRRHDSSSEGSQSSTDRKRLKSGNTKALSEFSENRNRKQSSDKESKKRRNKKRRDKESLDADTSDDSDNRLSKLKRKNRDVQSSKERPDLSQKKKKKSLSPSESPSSSSSSSEDEPVQERRIITKKPKLS